MKRVAAAVCLVLALASLSACGASDDGARGTTTGRPDGVETHAREHIAAEHLRAAVLRGLSADFRSGTEAGPVGFMRCLRIQLGRRLTDAKLWQLVAIHDETPYGDQLAAQAISDLAVRPGESCGGRQFVPEPIAASAALGRKYPQDPSARRLGLVSGPYVGVACGRANRPACDRVGIDLVVDRDAVAVNASIGGRSLRLRTPGQSNGVAGRDWVGFLDRVGLRRRGSPFAIPGDPHRKHARWAGYPAVFLPVRITVTYPDGTRRSAAFARVFLSPAWGAGSVATAASAPSSPAAAESRRVYSSRRDAFSVRLPSDWRRAQRRLVPKLLMPREIVSVGTFPMPVGGGGNCGREPAAAIRRMKPGDALISIQEYAVTAKMRAHLTHNFPALSLASVRAGLRHLSPQRYGGAGEKRPASSRIAYATLSFSDHGRAFDALVYFGGEPTPALRRTAASILASLRFQGRPREGPRGGA